MKGRLFAVQMKVQGLAAVDGSTVISRRTAGTLL